MTKAELMAEIDEIIKRGYAASVARAATTDDSTDTEQKIALVLEEAKSAKKGSMNVYEYFKNRICTIATTVKQHENAIRVLARTLCV